MAYSQKTQDPFYRYKIPPFILKYEKNKTVVENLVNIAKTVGRHPEMIQKFYSIQLGTAFIMKHQRYVLNGTYTNAQMQQCLDEFMKLYVLCSVCSNPETDVYKQKLSCRACGAKTILKDDKLRKYLNTRIKM